MAYDTTDTQKMHVLVDAVPVIKPSGSSTPEFMIKMDTILTSHVNKSEQFTELLWFHSIEERMTAGHATGDMKGTSTVEHSLLVVHLLNDAWMPTLRHNMRNGANIKEIIIKRMANVGEGLENSEVYHTSFTDSKIDRIEEYPDRLILSIRVKSRADVSKAVDQTGALLGNIMSDWDYSKAFPMGSGSGGPGGGGPGGGGPGGGRGGGHGGGSRPPARR